MFRKARTSHLLFAALVSYHLCCVLSATRIAKRSVDVEVLSPKQFSLSLSEGGLTHLDVQVMRNLSGPKLADFEVNKTDEKVLSFSRDDLDLQKGDVIWYNGVFKNDDIFFGEGGTYIFDGVYKNSPRTRRDADEKFSEEEDDHDTPEVESRLGHHMRRWRGPPRGHFPPPGPPRPHHLPPQGFAPPFRHGYHGRPGRWDRPGHDHRDHFGQGGPWDGHGYEDEEDFYGGRPQTKNPWKQNGNKRRPDFFGGDPFDDNDPNIWSDGEEDKEKSKSGGVSTSGGNRKPGDGVRTEPVTKRVTETTTTTTPLPQIDIRFSEVNEE